MIFFPSSFPMALGEMDTQLKQTFHLALVFIKKHLQSWPCSSHGSRSPTLYFFVNCLGLNVLHPRGVISRPSRTFSTASSKKEEAKCCPTLQLGFPIARGDRDLFVPVGGKLWGGCSGCVSFQLQWRSPPNTRVLDSETSKRRGLLR